LATSGAILADPVKQQPGNAFGEPAMSDTLTFDAEPHFRQAGRSYPAAGNGWGRHLYLLAAQGL